MNDKDREIERLEKLLIDTKRSWAYLFSFSIIGVGIALGVSEVRYERVTKYNQIFLKEINKIPTKQDTINFYQVQGLEKYIVNGNPVDVPYKEIKKIARGKK